MTTKVSSGLMGPRMIRANTGTTDTLVIGDAGNIVTSSNVSAQTVTIPPNSSVAFPVGTQIDIINKGAGVASVAGGAGVTLNGESTGTVLIDGQYKTVTIIKDATDTWFMVGDVGTPDVSINYEGKYAVVEGAADYDFTNVAIGAAATDRIVVICGNTGDDGTTHTQDSMTINGVSATKLVTQNSTTNYQIASIWAAAVPTGTSVTVNFVTSIVVNAKMLMVYSVYGASITPVDSATDISGQVVNLDLTIPAGGAGFCTEILSIAGVQTFTYVGMTEDEDSGNGTNDRESTCGSIVSATALTNRTVNITHDGAGGTTEVGVSVSLGKA